MRAYTVKNLVRRFTKIWLIPAATKVWCSVSPNNGATKSTKVWLNVEPKHGAMKPPIYINLGSTFLHILVFGISPLFGETKRQTLVD